MILYVKFIDPDDVYAIDPFYNSPSPDFEPPKVCGRCGEPLYIPVDLPDDIEIQQPLGEIIKPLPIDNPHLVTRSEPSLPTLFVSKKLDPNDDWDEIQRLKRFCNMAYVSKDGFDMLINDISHKPIKHTCNEY